MVVIQGAKKRQRIHLLGDLLDALSLICPLHFFPGLFYLLPDLPKTELQRSVSAATRSAVRCMPLGGKRITFSLERLPGGPT